MRFNVISDGEIPDTGTSTVYLGVDKWNDMFKFVTMFYMSLFDSNGTYHDIGSVKIGFKGQTPATGETSSSLGHEFEVLPEEYFSLGQDAEYYKKLYLVPAVDRNKILTALRDIVKYQEEIENIKGEEVFKTSILREVSLSSIKGQFYRVLNGQAELTDFRFKFVRENSPKLAGIELEFYVEESSKPSTNIHAVIGRNGVGKTTLLNGMIEAITNKSEIHSKFISLEYDKERVIENDYFSSLVSVSFSAFDPFEPPQEQPDPSMGTCYFYIGLKKSGKQLKQLDELYEDYVTALNMCFKNPAKKERWLEAIGVLESDENFESMQLQSLVNLSKDNLKEEALKRIGRMSSGHAVVLITITRLVSTVEEKTLVLIDEPESHLHPPLLSAFVRSLSNLLYDRNALAIMATHSPVVLQEIPKSCVWKVNRRGLSLNTARPELETFGENVGTLTREVFRLEVVKSGFHNLIIDSVATGKSYEEIINEYKGQIGLEARAILKALLFHRDNTNVDRPKDE